MNRFENRRFALRRMDGLSKSSLARLMTRGLNLTDEKMAEVPIRKRLALAKETISTWRRYDRMVFSTILSFIAGRLVIAVRMDENIIEFFEENVGITMNQSMGNALFFVFPLFSDNAFAFWYEEDHIG